MNSVTRLLGLGLLLVLAMLAAVLAGPALVPASTPADHAQVRESVSRNSKGSALSTLPQRVAFPLALVAVVIAGGLLVSLSFAPKTSGSRQPFLAAQTEMHTLARLAETSAAQEQALAEERGVRLRAEENSLLHQKLLNRSLEEKIRLGRDLHDGVIQSLYAAGLVIEAARTIVKTDPEEADRRLAQCQQNLNQSIRDARSYVVGLAPENLRLAGFAQALETVAAELRGTRDVKFDFKIDDAATALLSPDQSTEALQIAREAISNSLRHGHASAVTVRLHHGDGEVCLLVQDNGTGFDLVQRANCGHGLGNMQARAQRVGGVVRMESRAGEGSRVVLTVPLRSV